MMMSDIRSRIDVLFEQLAAEGYLGHQGHVGQLITQCREMLMRGTGRLGPWEAQQLDAAEHAASSNFLRVGLIAAQNALAISQLSAEEYEYGMNHLGHTAVPSSLPLPEPATTRSAKKIG